MCKGTGSGQSPLGAGSIRSGKMSAPTDYLFCPLAYGSALSAIGIYLLR